MLSNTSMLMLLAKATLILLTALGITVVMQRASAGARHLVWLVTLGTLLVVPAIAYWAPLRLEVLPAVEAPSVVTDNDDAARASVPDQVAAATTEPAATYTSP
jgi:hypothetical protein